MLPFRTQAVFNTLVLGVKARHNSAGGHEGRPGRLAVWNPFPEVFLCRLCGTHIICLKADTIPLCSSEPADKATFTPPRMTVLVSVVSS